MVAKNVHERSPEKKKKSRLQIQIIRQFLSALIHRYKLTPLISRAIFPMYAK